MQAISYSAKRRSERLPATIPISLYFQREDSKTDHDAWIVDISSNGARVRSTFVLFVGQTVGIVPLGDFGEAIPYRVVWVERSASGCLAGLALLETAQA